MKYFILIVSMFLSINLSAQFMVGIGLDNYSIETREASNLGIDVSLGFYGVYLGFSSNLATGDGEHLEFSSDQTFDAKKVRIYSYNIGYMIHVKRFHFVPIIGLVTTENIYQDPIGWDTYYFGEAAYDVSFSGRVFFDISQGINIYAGAGTKETFSAGIAVLF
jgi:hypothetical protein